MARQLSTMASDIKKGDRVGFYLFTPGAASGTFGWLNAEKVTHACDERGQVFVVIQEGTKTFVLNRQTNVTLELEAAV